MNALLRNHNAAVDGSSPRRGIYLLRRSLIAVSSSSRVQRIHIRTQWGERKAGEEGKGRRDTEPPSTLGRKPRAEEDRVTDKDKDPSADDGGILFSSEYSSEYIIATLCMCEMKLPGRMASDAIVRAERGSNEPR